MNTIAKFLLFLFIAFLSTPTLVTIIKKDCNNAMFHNMSEEEHSIKEVKNYFYTIIAYQIFTLTPRICKVNLIESENLSKHDNVSTSIFSPPPNLV